MIQLLYNHCKWNIQCPVQLVGSSVTMEVGVGEGWPLSWLISLWCWPHSLSPVISRDWGVKLIQFRTNKLRQIVFLSEGGTFGFRLNGEVGSPKPQHHKQWLFLYPLWPNSPGQTEQLWLKWSETIQPQCPTLAYDLNTIFSFSWSKFPIFSHLQQVIFVAKTNIRGFLVLLFWGTILVQSALPKETQPMIPFVLQRRFFQPPLAWHSTGNHHSPMYCHIQSIQHRWFLFYR